MAKPEARARNLRRLWLGSFCALALLGVAAAAHAGAMEEAERAMRIGDVAAAARFLRAAADQGDAEAQYQLGALHRSGNGVPKSHTEALRWFEAAGRQGHARAQYNAGVFYEKGWGTAASSQDALRWLRLAAGSGDARAGARVDALLGTGRAARKPETFADAAGLEDALRRLIRKGDAAGVESLLRQRESHSRTTPAGAAPAAGPRGLLHEAVDTGSPEILQLLIRAGEPLDTIDAIGETALMLAARRGADGCIEVLGKAGAGLGLRDPGGRTALMLAAQHGRAAAVDSLLALGAEPAARDRTGLTAGDLAGRAGHHELAKRLPRGRKAESRARERRSWLSSLVDANQADVPPLVIASVRNEGDTVRQLAALGADLEARDGEDQTALMLAAAGGGVDAVAALLEAGAKTTAPIGQPYPIALAAREGHVSVIDLLLDHGASPAGDPSAPSPLSLALDAGHPDAAMHLLAAGAAPDRRAFASAARIGDERVLASLARHGGEAPGPEELAAIVCGAADSGSAGSLRVALDLGGLPATVCKDGVPLLARCSAAGHITSVKLLLDRGAEVDQRTASGNTALQLAAHAGRRDVVGALLEAGADIGARGDRRRTALMAASRAGHVDVVELLLERGADAGQRNHGGQTARTLAELAGHSAVVRAIDHRPDTGWFR